MKQGTIALVLSPHPFHSIPISCSVIPPALLASLRESRIGVCLSANLFLGNKVIFLAAIAFYGSPPNDATGQAGREASGTATSTASVHRRPQPRGGAAWRSFLSALSVLPCIVRVPSLFHMQPTSHTVLNLLMTRADFGSR